MTSSPNGPLRVGIGGPVGSGKTALMEALCKAFRDRYDICAITNDIYTKEDALILNGKVRIPIQIDPVDVRRGRGHSQRLPHAATVVAACGAACRHAPGAPSVDGAPRDANLPSGDLDDR